MAIAPVKSITARPKKFFVRLSNGATPSVFVAPCGFTEKSFTRSKSFGESVVPNCPDDGDTIDWVERDVISMTSSISGQGVMAQQSTALWEAALANPESVLCEVEIEWPNGASEVYTGRYHLESLELGAPNGQRVTANVAMQSDGPIEHTSVAP